jgi:hypothetical protein
MRGALHTPCNAVHGARFAVHGVPQTSSYDRTRMTTRRFWARPSRVLFGATGFSSP